ncbi:MAG: HNH endonuclease, partial [Polyangiales bacterium]
DLTRTLSLTLPVEEAWALEATRMMLEHMDGKHTGAHFLESLLAEATIPLLDLTAPAQAQETDQPDQADQPNQPDVTAQMEAEHTAWRAQMQRLQHQQAEAELQSRPAVPTDPNPGEAPDADDLPIGLQALDARLRHYSAELASRDLFFGRMAQRFLALRGWQTLGFTTEAHYARERLGMSRASLRSKLSLARRSQALHQVADALQQGQIGFEAAQLIARIATPTTERAWLTRATRRTFKHLREEVQAIEMATRYLGQTDTTPPTEAQLQQVESTERAILSGDLLRRIIRNLESEPNEEAVQISVTPNDEAPKEPVQISVGPSAKITLRIRVPGDVLLHYRQFERLHRKNFPNESFIEFLCVNFWQVWVPHLGTSDRWEMIYRRDRYRCTSPVCHQRNVTLHHVKYRANGGTDAPDNLTSPCAFCHLEGEHGGRLKILHPGSDPTWLLGRHPIMRVRSRERTLLA